MGRVGTTCGDLVKISDNGNAHVAARSPSRVTPRSTPSTVRATARRATPRVVGMWHAIGAHVGPEDPLVGAKSADLEALGSDA